VRPTGNRIIDRMIGGFPSGLPLVVAGAGGTGRTVIALELAHHALARGEPVRFLTTEAAPSLLRHALSLGFAFEPALKADRLGILELHASAPALLREGGVEPLVTALEAELDGPALILVDPLSALLAQVVDEAKLREIVRGFARALAQHELVFTVEEERQTGTRALELVLSELCGAYFRLEREASGRRIVTLEKTRAGVAASERVEFAIGFGGSHVVEDGVESPAARRAMDAAVSAAAPAIAPPPKPEPKPVARPKLLVVDDDRLQCEVIADWLSARYELVSVADGFEALAALVSQQPDLVILDLVMPRVTGYELLYAMRRAGFDVPVLVASSRIATMGDRLGPLVLGATDFISKPLSRVELMHKVETLLRLPRSREARAFGEVETEALFGSFAGSRLLEMDEFAERVARAVDFGEKYGMTSSLVAICAESGEDLDRWIEVANRHLRFEDAMLRLDKRTAIVLFVATAPQYAPRVVERLASLGENGPLPPVTSEVWLAERDHASPEVLESLAESIGQQTP
jgi:CheY-like chemotaxis protein/archaellum biogenesis ATPase FlaH